MNTRSMLVIVPLLALGPDLLTGLVSSLAPNLAPDLIQGLAGEAHAQGTENYWISPDGGDWNNPANWSFNQVPDEVVPGYFTLPISYTVFSDQTFTRGIYVDAGRIDFVSVPNQGSFYDFEVLQLLEITGDASSMNGARLRLGNPGRAFVDTLSLGLGRLGSGFTIGSQRQIDVLTLTTNRYASLRFELGDHSSTIDEVITVMLDIDAPCGFEVVPANGSFLPPGESLRLIDADPAGASTVLPEFGRAETPPGTDLLVEIERRKDGSLSRMTAKSELAESTGIADSSFNYIVDAVPIDLLPIDYDDDGDDDLIVIQESGKHEVFELTTLGYVWLEYLETQPAVRAATTGDFDDDGKTDIAVASELDLDGNGTEESLLQIFLAADGFDPGPSIDSEDSPVSLAAIRVPSSNLFSGTGGVALSTRNATSGAGRTKSYDTSSTDVSKAGEVDVGDDPGPSDPIDDENKKDPDSPVGVGSTAGALVANPIFQVLRPTLDGFEIEKTISVSGRVIDFDSGDIDGDGEIETLVLTSANRIDLLRPLRSEDVYGSIGFKAEAVSIALANLDDDSSPEVVVGFRRTDGTGFLRIYRVDRLLVPDSPTGSEVRPYLARQAQVSLAQFTDPLVSASSLSNGFFPVAAVDDFGMPMLRTFDYRRIPVTSCDTFDLNGDGVVDANDLGALIASWGPCGKKGCPADFNGDGRVDSADLGLLFSNWGPC